MAADFISARELTEMPVFALADPPTWTRLEPQSSSGDPSPGTQARVHDPLWLIGRQWQLGEFEGEDAGTPLTVRVVTATTAVDRWAARDDTAGIAFGRERQELLEPLVEREPVGEVSPGLRARAEAAAALLAALADAGLGGLRAEVVVNCPLDLDPLHHPDGTHAALDPHWLRLARLLDGRGMADGELIADALGAAAPALPAWLTGADEAGVRAVTDPWLSWYRAEVSPPAGGTDAWVGPRLEHSFRIGAGDVVLDAPSHSGGDVDWYSFEPAAAGATLSEPVGARAAAPPQRRVHALLATPLRYPGMPADRLWEMEDAAVSLGVVESEPWDLARLLVAEFALTYGNDWLVVPVDVPFGSLTTVESVVYTTTFGEHFVVRPTDVTSPDSRWRMFTITSDDGVTADGLLVPPGAVAVQDGPAVEEVLFLRDEMANLVWAVERSVEGPSGLARDRSREHDDPPAPTRGPVTRAALDYSLQTGVPARWIPYVPRSTGYRSVELVQGRMPRPDGTQAEPQGRFLARTDTREIADAEIPREGLLIRRQPSITRLPDGSYLRWTTRRVGVGRGEGASQLAFDSAIARRPAQ
ncbi:hypothetical protein [Nocardia sp. NPDC019255]|uniref:hypothetical protein n=1 Tax=Nocardia sp. NPDC019255 TaxID=3154591 RepID=UPI0033EF6930